MSLSSANNIEQQLAHLRWKRMQNEREIKKSLEATKLLQHKDGALKLNMDPAHDRTVWVQSVVSDELIRPLVLSDEQVHRTQIEGAKAKTKLEKISKDHLHAVTRMCDKISSHQIHSVYKQRDQEEQLKQLMTIRKKLKIQLKQIEHKSPIISPGYALPKVLSEI